MTDDMLYLKHIRDAIEKIEKYIAVGRDVFIPNLTFFKTQGDFHETRRELSSLRRL